MLLPTPQGCITPNRDMSSFVPAKVWTHAFRRSSKTRPRATTIHPSLAAADRWRPGGSPTDQLLLDKRTIHLLGDRLQQIVHYGPAAGLHEDFGRHAWDELQAAQTATLIIGQHRRFCAKGRYRFPVVILQYRGPGYGCNAFPPW